MRALVPLLALSLMGGCAEPQVLLSERIGPVALDEPCPSRVAQRQVPLHIINGFSAEEEAKIIAAVVDWNRKGAVRFNVAALNYDTVEPAAWSVVKRDDAVDVLSVGRLEPAAVTHRSSTSGGSIVVNANRLGNRDLRAVIAQELGVASGGDDPARSTCIASDMR